MLKTGKKITINTETQTVLFPGQMNAMSKLSDEGFPDSELFRWYGSAAPVEYLDAHHQIQRVSF